MTEREALVAEIRETFTDALDAIKRGEALDFDALQRRIDELRVRWEALGDIRTGVRPRGAAGRKEAMSKSLSDMSLDELREADRENERDAYRVSKDMGGTGAQQQDVANEGYAIRREIDRRSGK